MATKKKLLEAAAGNAGGGGLNVEDVFSTYLYTGNATSRSITNGIDLAGEGGLVWLKDRVSTQSNSLFDTERGPYKYLFSDTTDSEYNYPSNTLTSFNSDGFSMPAASYFNYSGGDYASWTFRKAPKFFDVVTYTGTGSAQNISHDLGSVPGMVVVKKTTVSGANSNWTVWHNGLSSNSNYLRLNKTDAEATASSQFNGTAPTSTVFSVGASSNTNASGEDYVAYLFAHNDGDGEFGPTGDQDIIKCGSYTGLGTETPPEISLGFEPQWMLVKNVTNTSDWFLVDTMRGWGAPSTTMPEPKGLSPNRSYAEATTRRFGPTATGFMVRDYHGDINLVNNTYIYMAIRRGPMAVPESATDVFAVSDGSAGASGNAGRYRSGFPVDMGLERDITGTDNWEAVTRLLQGTSLRPNGTNVEDTGVGAAQFDYMDGWNTGTAWADSYSWMWKRAPNFFDVVAYTGDGVVGRTVSHNLGVAPEMIWVKQRNTTGDWGVYHKDIGNDKVLILNANIAETSLSTAWNNTTPTDASFTVGTWVRSNGSGSNIIAYLFASLDGVSKVGSYTGDGTTGRVIDCGFSSGARFVLIRRTDIADNWYVWDSERGIVTGNDPYLLLNKTFAEDNYGAKDAIDPHSSGFIINQEALLVRNASGGSYIFYAVA